MTASDDFKKPATAGHPHQYPHTEDGTHPAEQEELPGIEAADATAASSSTATSKPANASASAGDSSTDNLNSASSSAPELDKEQRKAEILKRYKEAFPKKYESLIHYIETLESLGPKFVLPKTIDPDGKKNSPEDDLQRNVQYLELLLDRSSFSPTKQKTEIHLKAHSAGGFINYESARISYKNKDFGFSQEKNKSLFTINDALLMAQQARHRPDMLPPNGIKLTGSKHYRALVQLAIDEVNKELAPEERMQVTNPISAVELTKLFGTQWPQANPAAQQNGPSGNQPAANNPGQADATPQTSQQKPASGTQAVVPQAAETPPPPAQANTTAEQSAAPKPQQYAFDALDETIKAAAIEHTRKTKPEISEEKVRESWNNGAVSDQKAWIGFFQARQFEKQIAEEPDVTKIATQIGVTKENPNISVYEGELSYPPHSKDNTATVRFVMEDDGKKPLVIRVSGNDPYVNQKLVKYTLDDKAKTDFENGVAGITLAEPDTSPTPSEPAPKPSPAPPPPA